MNSLKTSIRSISILGLLFLSLISSAQVHCLDQRYGETSTFDIAEIDTISNVTYATATQYFTGLTGDLKMDVFMPNQEIDEIEKRPFILMIHGGGFINGTRNEMYNECIAFAQRGFVAATITYRLGWNCDNVFCVNCYGTNMQKAIYTAVQDARAAMRYCVSHKDEWGIDENWMFIGGESAGSIAALLAATWDQTEANASVPEGFENEVSGLDESGNTLTDAYQIKAVVDHCGAVLNLQHLDNNTDLPIISFHDSNDCVVPYDFGPVIACLCSGFLYVAGSHQIHLKRLDQNECTELNTVPQLGLPNHCQFPQDNLVNLASCFLKRIMCGYCMSFQNSDIYAKALCNSLHASNSVILGCTYSQASNYNNEATEDDGSCLFTLDCAADFDMDGIVTINDLMIFIAAYGSTCPQ